MFIMQLKGKHRGRNMHGIDKDKPFLDSTILQALVDLRCDIDEGPSGGNMEEQFFAKAFHG